MAKKKSSTSFQPRASPLKHTKLPPSVTPPPSNGGRQAPKLLPLLIGGGLLYVGAVYVSMTVFKNKNNALQKEESLEEKETSKVDTSAVWNRIAKDYDNEISWDELVMGIGIMRRFLIGQAKGDVLEVSTGTGRNFEYYKTEQVESATFTDGNAGMLAEASSKFDKFKEQFHKTFVEFKQAKVEKLGAKQYDTVVDTFGLCSCEDPEAAVISLAEACKRSESSRILLLEHGRSHYDWLNGILDGNVDKHVSKWGCWWNRDLVGLLERPQVQEKLEIVSVHRWHLGTTCYVVAKPRLTASE